MQRCKVLYINTSNIPCYSSCRLPQGSRNYALFDQNKVDCFVSQKENALPYLADILIHSNNEAEITETLYIIDRMADEGVKGLIKCIPFYHVSTIQHPLTFRHF